MLLVVGPVEELCKFAAVRFGAYRSLHFDEPLDGLVYAAVASLGFASLENFFYVVDYGPEVMLVRAPLSTVGHLVDGGIWGYALGQHHASGEQRGRMLAGFLALAAVAHGLFNVLLHYFPLVTLLYPIVGGILTYRAFRKGDATSPYLTKRNNPLVSCNDCSQAFIVTEAQCPNCGAARPVAGSADLICGRCAGSNPPDASYCTSCGDELVRQQLSNREEATTLVTEAAGFWRRLIAQVIDVLIPVCVLLFVVINYVIFIDVVYGEAHADSFFGARLNEVSDWVYLAVLLFAVAVYQTALIANWATTPGKRLFGLYVARTDGSRVGPGRALARFFASLLSASVLGVGFLLAALRKDKRALHDLICDSKVIRRVRRSTKDGLTASGD